MAVKGKATVKADSGGSKHKGSKSELIRRAFARKSEISATDVVMKFFNDKIKIDRSEVTGLVREFNAWRKKNPLKATGTATTKPVPAAVEAKKQAEEQRAAPMVKKSSSYERE